EEYIKYCSNNELPCEILKTSVEIDQNTTITQIIEYAQNNAKNKSKIIDRVKSGLFELITVFAKLSAVNICKIKKFRPDFDEYDYEVLRFFALTNAYSIRIEKIKRRIIEFCPTALKIKEELFKILEIKYGKKQNALISTNEHEGHGVLVSGDDLIELEHILKTVEEMNIKDKINVYTNGSLLLAHFYPYFQNNKFLKGHWGVNDAHYDFSMFKGSVIVTRNFLQKIDSLYKGEIFSNKVISFSKVNDIKDNDYTPAIQSALNIQEFAKDSKNKTLDINYDIDKINKTINDIVNSKEKEVVIVAGSLDSKKISEEYKNRKIIHFSCPLESDILINSIKILRENNIKITLFFPHCDIESMYNTLIFLGKDIQIYISNCSNIIINPHVIEALCSQFNVEIIN
ncbi:hypothetical protein IJ531_06350, partial [bacterium]|nr:hypothetical protein [bacterium]